MIGADAQIKIRLTRKQHARAFRCAKYLGTPVVQLLRMALDEKIENIEDRQRREEAERRAKRAGMARIADVPGEEPRRGPGRPRKIRPIPEAIAVSGAIDITDSDDATE